MVRDVNARRFCTLYNREVYFGECYEVQEVREDEMDPKLLMEPFDMERAKEACERCRWYEGA